MALTPVEVRHFKPPKRFLGGYRTHEVDELLNEIVVSFEDVVTGHVFDVVDRFDPASPDLLVERLAAPGDALVVEALRSCGHEPHLPPASVPPRLSTCGRSVVGCG